MVTKTNANQIAYTPAEGGVPATLENKLRETVSVKDFGAKGDGVTDDTAAIQAALNFISNNDVLFFPAGRYRVSAPLVMDQTKVWQTIRGTAVPMGSSGKSSAANVRSAIIFFGLPAGSKGITTNAYPKIENIAIIGPGALAGGTTIGIYSERELNANDVSVTNWDTGVSLVTSYYSRLNNINFRYNALALRVDSCFTTDIKNISVNGGRLTDQPTGNGVYITSSQVNFYGGSIETYYGDGGYAICVFGNSNKVNIYGMYFEPYGDETKIASAAIFAVGRGWSISINDCVCYTYYQESFVKVDPNAYSFILSSRGNTFKNSSTYLSTLYTLPTSASVLSSSSVVLKDDNIYDCAVAPTYTVPTLPSSDFALKGCNVSPPNLGHTVPNTDHEFLGRPQVNNALTVAPSTPIRGVIYWANGTTWNPFRSQFSPYPVIYDGSGFKQVVPPTVLTIANNADLTLLPNGNALCLTGTAQVTIKLPESPPDGSTHTIKMYGGANAATVSANGRAFEDGTTTRTLVAGTYQAITVTFSSYTNRWVIVGMLQ